ncbi:hypothetical protein SAMN03159417_04039 [Ralstonia sp. NFACC01]|nr:hypothetical protein SAMN03159417_04039 [Ralstonia sp. NFACC01]
MRKRKTSTTKGGARAAKKTNVAKREQTNIIDSANRWFGIATLVSKCWFLLESLPWDYLHHHLK